MGDQQANSTQRCSFRPRWWIPVFCLHLFQHLMSLHQSCTKINLIRIRSCTVYLTKNISASNELITMPHCILPTELGWTEPMLCFSIPIATCCWSPLPPWGLNEALVPRSITLKHQTYIKGRDQKFEPEPCLPHQMRLCPTSGTWTVLMVPVSTGIGWLNHNVEELLEELCHPGEISNTVWIVPLGPQNQITQAYDEHTHIEHTHKNTNARTWTHTHTHAHRHASHA